MDFSKARIAYSTAICLLISISVCLLLLLVPPSVQAAWTDISAQVKIDVSNPVRSRRTPDATVTVTVTNSGPSIVNTPLRLVLGSLTPDTVSLSGSAGTTQNGEPFVDLAPYSVNGLAAGASTGPITLTILGGGSVNFNFYPRVEQDIAEQLSVDITTPTTLITVGSSPVQVSGTISDPSSTLTINGAVVSHSRGTFSAAVSLEEGHNTIIARVVNASGEEVTDSISVSLDRTPPYITVETPVDGQTIYAPRVSVSGLVNDIVRGTISEGQANVVVNGVQASVSNRTYLAENIPLQQGPNVITINASDQVGNTASKSFNVNYVLPAPKRIELVSGQNQSAGIRSVLANPLTVRLFGADGQPVVNQNVVFRVIQGDGILGIGTATESQGVLVQTDATGTAQTNYRTGSRSGTGNHRVRAKAVGFEGEIIFYASATPNPGDKVSVNSGNNQRGSINQPLPHPFVAVVTDSGANVIQNVQVEFAVTRGGGQFQNGSTTYTTQTDSDGRASAQLTLGTEVGMDNHRVTATLVGTSLNAGFTASAFVPADPGNTRISGVVLDNQDTPLPGVTIRVDGTTRQSVTDTQGRFTITEVPVGPVHLLADGSTTSVPGEWPTLSYNIVTIAGVDNPLSAPIYLVRLNTTNATLAGREDVEITIPEVPGFKLEVRAGSVTFPDGSREGLVSATPVNASKVPMAPPNGMQPQFIVTIQPAGTRFDPPAKITMPNVDGHLPGAQVEMYSYDHDLEEFVSIGLGTVSLDGSVIKSNTGVGIIKAGWFCSSVPIPSSCVGSCPICQGIVAACTECQNVSDDPRLIDTPGDCKVPYCSNGQADTAPNLFDEPANPCETCSADGEKIHVVEPIPVLRVPEPSAYPPHDVIDFVGTLRPDHRDDVWGEQYTDIEFTFRCRPYCESGSQRFVITGDITPGPGWRVNVYSQMQARQDIFGQDVVNCSIEPVPLEIIGSTILHELKHSNAYIDLMNRYKTRFATGVRYNSQAECDAAFNPIYSEYDNDLRLLNEREEAHSNYCGDPQYGLYCDQTNTTVTYLRGRYCQ